MPKPSPSKWFVADTECLKAIGEASANLKTSGIELLASGRIGVPICVWDEFKKAYPDLALALKPHIKRKVRTKIDFELRAAVIAELNPGLISNSPFDNHADIYVAAIAATEGVGLITCGHARVSFFSDLACCTVAEFEAMLELLAEADAKVGGAEPTISP